jgi:thiamine kinase-like enzyme
VLVHGDVSPKNVLAGPTGPVLIDAECAWFGDPAFDLAFCLNHFLLKAAHLRHETESLMSCFNEMTRTYFAHVRWEPSRELERRTASLLPGLTLARVAGKSPVEYLSGPARERVRKLAMQLLLQQPTSLESVAAFWTGGLTS